MNHRHFSVLGTPPSGKFGQSLAKWYYFPCFIGNPVTAAGRLMQGNAVVLAGKCKPWRVIRMDGNMAIRCTIQHGGLYYLIILSLNKLLNIYPEIKITLSHLSMTLKCKSFFMDVLYFLLFCHIISMNLPPPHVADNKIFLSLSFCRNINRQKVYCS